MDDWKKYKCLFQKFAMCKYKKFQIIGQVPVWYVGKAEEPAKSAPFFDISSYRADFLTGGKGTSASFCGSNLSS